MNGLICPRCAEPKKPSNAFCETCTYFESEPRKRNRIGDAPIEITPIAEPVEIQMNPETELSDDKFFEPLRQN